MIKRYLLIILAFLIVKHSFSQNDINFYLSGKVTLNPEISSPEEFLGYQIGEKHVNHDHLVNYLRFLASTSDRIHLENYGFTYENRPLLLLTISDPANLKNIEEIRQNHLRLSDPELSSEININDQPVIIWLGYSVHGNEPSGANASLMVTYYLAACDDEELKNILKNTIILLDPCINPDGFNRFAQWVNQFKSNVQITDPNNIEHNEPWPGGRTNHYWFDLNRDWLLLQQPETKARIIKYHQWLPNILTDHHEMGSNSTFFFQPGIPSRDNPNTPPEAYSITNMIADYHASALDQIGSLYYARETFDDFYYGKGSTYPDINGGIGILFEQASSRGHARETDHGILTFPFTIRNQFTTSLSSIRAGYELREELLDHQRNFYKNAIIDSEKDHIKGYVFEAGSDDSKLFHFLKILDQHQIRIYRPNYNIDINGYQYNQSHSYIIPTKQSQYRLIKVIFEKTTEFNDSLFYDVSSWTLPLAFDIKYDELTDKDFKSTNIGEKISEIVIPKGKLLGESTYGYLINWDIFQAPKALFMLQEQGILTKIAKKQFITTDGVSFKEGTIFIPVQSQPIEPDALKNILINVSKSSGQNIIPVSSGYSLSGINLGSPNMETVKKPELILLVGKGISSSEAGEVWHLLDYRFNIPVSLISIDIFNSINLNEYNTIIMVNGNYNAVNDTMKAKMKQWTEEGGHIIAFKGGARWLADQQLAYIEFRQPVQDTIDQKRYDDLSRDLGAQAIGGSIFKTKVDLTHPLCYGYPDEDVFVFKNSKYFFDKSKNPYNNPVIYTEDPLVSGYISDNNYDKIKGASAVIVSTIGRGKTICFSDNPNFRGYWFGTNRLFFNAIFFGDLISSRSAR